MDPCPQYLETALYQEFFQIFEKFEYFSSIQERRQIIVNCRPISLLPIIGKVFESIFLIQYSSILVKIIYYQKTSLDSNLPIHVSIDSFPLSMTYMHPLIATHHMMPEGFFKDISKAFDRVWWHDERICKI